VPISSDTVDHLKEYIPFDEVPGLLPPLRGKKPINVSTVYRWSIDGCRGTLLRYLAIASKRFTTREWLAEFLAAINGQAVATEDARPRLTSPQKPADDQSIDQKLDRFKV
jgi:hypothetical protein